MYHILPGGVYGLDFDSPPTYESIGIEFGVPQDVSSPDAWHFCTRTAPPPPLFQLTVVNNVSNDNGGNADVSNFTLRVGTTTVASGETKNFEAGTYTITETGPDGYTKTFGGDCDANGQITLETGDQSKTCTITNDDIAPTITLTKSVVNSAVSNASPDDFGISIGGSIVTSGSTTQVMANRPIIINEAGLSGYDFVSITGENCPTQLGGSVVLSPGQSINCTITNAYSIPPPPTPKVSKVIFIPGLGASWNIDALLNCKTSNYSGGWTLAPYAEGIYKPILEALVESGWEVQPFYYDFRRNIGDNVPILANMVNPIGPNEKINLIGHSMGGLIGRSYLESDQGSKLNSILTVGSPYQGAVEAYPVFSGGEVWDDNLFTKIATTLYLQRCGRNQIQSIQNLLPTFDYLKDSKTHQFKSVSQMNAKNNWQQLSLPPGFWGVRFGTISGTGFPTPEIVNVTNPSKSDVRGGNWLDGKPVSTQNSNLGDGTVLTRSSQIDGGENQTIHQDHSGIVASYEGVSKILGFLGIPTQQAFSFVKPVIAKNVPDNSIYAEPKSALIIIGYPGSFWIKDEGGNVIESQKGIISLMNPKTGNYELQIIPQSNDTLIIVSQFLSNGNTLYREYHFKGISPKTEDIKFDTKHPSNDILKDRKDYKDFRFPWFPQFWHWEWKWPFKK
jgi:pimeloyl-ACP methyl ester carboxylesterase